ncbi:MAG: poly[(R)-3-hydroxyalkanoate] polymerase subunit PhaC [Solirubrobacteraceae bacterium]|nr:poly[(R)-3-hydroxyalkanoate] polymerase subunit PhaC [Solirubrobacteraceae bacterium]
MSDDALPEPDARAAGRGSLDQVLTDAALRPGRRIFPGAAGVKAAAKLAARPATVARRGLELGTELAKITAGRSSLEPPRGDRRFKDPAWSENPAFRRLAQGYLAMAQAADRLLCDAGLDETSERRVRFAVENVVDALAPTNFPATNPAVLKTTIDTGGRNFVSGARQFARDMSRPPRIPAMVDRSAFEVGENLAVTPGDVVLRNEQFELIQYLPSTPRVRTVPLLVVPPMINKYYVADLAPGRSMIEHAVGAEQQTFAISWRNPDERHADWGLDVYAGAVVEALDAVRAISGSKSSHALGLCAGGITLASAVSHLVATGRAGQIAGLTLGVCVIDNEDAGTAGAFVDRNSAALALAESHRRGYLDGRALAGVFAWLRPNDLIWNYWVNNYLLGKDPPAFDILYWNADTTNMPAALHRDFLEIALTNSLVRPGSQVVLGTPVDLSAIEADSYVVAGIADHITPWENAYRTTRLLGSEPRFVLSTSGHIAAMVNPPGNERARYQTADSNPADPAEWLAGAAPHRGTWWEDWARWLGERSGRRRAAPTEAGGAGFEPLGPAPGTYVHE